MGDGRLLSGRGDTNTSLVRPEERLASTLEQRRRGEGGVLDGRLLVGRRAVDGRGGRDGDGRASGRTTADASHELNPLDLQESKAKKAMSV